MRDYITNSYNKLDAYDDRLGDQVGAATRSIVTSINPVIGGAMVAGHIVNDAMPRDKNGNYTNAGVAALGSVLDPFETFDEAARDFKHGRIGRGIVKGFLPGFSGVLDMKDKRKEAAEKQKTKYISSVGEYNPLAGKIAGNSTGAGIITQENFVTPINENGNKLGASDFAEALNAGIQIYGGAKTGKIDMFKKGTDSDGLASTVSSPMSEAVPNADVSGIKDPAVQSTVADVLGTESSVSNPLDVSAPIKPDVPMQVFDSNKIDALTKSWEYDPQKIGMPPAPPEQLNSSGYFGALDQSMMPYPQSNTGFNTVQGLAPAASDMLFQWQKDTKLKKEEVQHANEYQLEGLNAGYPMLLGSEGNYNY